MKTDRTVCPLCGYSALRLESPKYETDGQRPVDESARWTWSVRYGQRYCIRCHEWVLPELRSDYDHRHGLDRPPASASES